jgi:integration host factor subunit beta
MVKSELLNAIAAKIPASPHKEVEKTVNQLISIWIEALANGERIEVRGFGSISLRYRKARNNARNPKNGDIVVTLEKWRPHFKAGLEMRNKVNASLPKTTKFVKEPQLEEAIA